MNHSVSSAWVSRLVPATSVPVYCGAAYERAVWVIYRLNGDRPGC